MYHARFKGSHYKAGYKWGKLLFEHGKTLEYCPTFTPDDAMRKFARLCKAEYKKYYPELLDEIQGIADGQRLPVERPIRRKAVQMIMLADNMPTGNDFPTGPPICIIFS